MPDRLTSLRKRLQELKFDAFLITSLSNLRYLTGFTGSNAIGLITREAFWFVTDYRYREQAAHEIQSAEVIVAQQNLFTPLKEKVKLRPKARLGFEAEHLSFRNFSRIRDLFGSLQLVATEKIIERITIQKLPGEVEKVRQACRVAEKVWQALVGKIRPGIAELDLSAEISYLTRTLGAEGDAFEPIVASGWRSALPHGIASHKKLQAGELVVIDFGCTCEGFHSDVTRTVFLGEPAAEPRAMYDAVARAGKVALRAIRPGMKAVALDKVARDFLKTKGYEKEFNHSLGHGLGIEVHSLPRIGLKSKDTIPLHSIFTIEPGVYRPQLGGVRIEDDVYLGPHGPEVLTRIDREPVIIE